MIIDNQIEGLTCDMSGNFLDIYLDENNNSLSNIDNLSNLPKSTFSFKTNVMQCIDDKHNMDENEKIDQIKISKASLNYQTLKIKATKNSVKRALFVEKDEINHEANIKLVQKQLEELEKQESEKWNFDFKNNCPLLCQNNRYEWFKEVRKPLGKQTIENLDAKQQVSPSKQSDNIPIRWNLKRKSSISDYFPSTKKRVNILGKDQVVNTVKNEKEVLSSVNNTVNYKQNEIKKNQSSYLNKYKKNDKKNKSKNGKRIKNLNKLDNSLKQAKLKF